MDDAYGTLSCQALKIELAKRSAPTHGKKKDLVERLRAYDRNAGFVGNSSSQYIPEEIPMPTWPSDGIFRTLTVDLQAECPHLQLEHIEHYVIHRQGNDVSAVNDIKGNLRYLNNSNNNHLDSVVLEII